MRPKRCETDEVGYFGECLFCNADQGQACLPPIRMLTIAEAQERQRAYEAQRVKHRLEHPLKPALPFREDAR
jgi:hypothetical protein